MSRPTPNYDVYLSHTRTDLAVAAVVKQQFQANGLSVFDITDQKPGADLYEGIRQGIQDSLVFVALVTPAALQSSNLAFEYGTAWGWSTPCFVLTAGSEFAEFLAPPAFLQRLPRYSYPADLPKLVADIREQSAPLTDAEKHALVEAYTAVGVAVDQLQTDPLAADRLRDRFAAKAHRPIQGFRLIRELLRLRKRRQLPRLANSVAG
jgi:hypothetical protein